MKDMCNFCDKEIYSESPYYDSKTKKYYHMDCLKIEGFILNNKAKVRQILKGDKNG